MATKKKAEEPKKAGRKATIGDLNLKQKLFCKYILQGETQRSSYILAFDLDPNDPLQVKNADSLASRLMKNDKIKKYIDKKMRELTEVDIITRNEVLLALKRAMLVASGVDENLIIESLEQDDGLEVTKLLTTKTKKAMDTKALCEVVNTISKLIGWDKSEQTNNNISINISGGDTLED